MKLLLHICCAHCGIAAIEKLLPDFKLSLFWYNPNIHTVRGKSSLGDHMSPLRNSTSNEANPLTEHQKRLVDVKKLAKLYKLDLIVNNDDFKKWFVLTNGLEKEPEGGKRCSLCFKMRLGKTVEFAKKNSFDYWGTTLTTGPQKDAQVINSIGALLAKEYDLQFYPDDFKKKEGFKKSVILGKKYNFYRQNYCGCIFSQKG